MLGQIYAKIQGMGTRRKLALVACVILASLGLWMLQASRSRNHGAHNSALISDTNEMAQQFEEFVDKPFEELKWPRNPVKPADLPRRAEMAGSILATFKLGIDRSLVVQRLGSPDATKQSGLTPGGQTDDYTVAPRGSDGMNRLRFIYSASKKLELVALGRD